MPFTTTPKGMMLQSKQAVLLGDMQLKQRVAQRKPQALKSRHSYMQQGVQITIFKKNGRNWRKIWRMNMILLCRCILLYCNLMTAKIQESLELMRRLTMPWKDLVLLLRKRHQMAFREATKKSKEQRVQLEQCQEVKARKDLSQKLEKRIAHHPFNLHQSADQ